MKPICTIIAGVNGAGKTTFAMDYLVKHTHYLNFINADLIAFGLSPLSSERVQITAGRLFLQQINKAIRKRENFAFETTLSGKAYLKLIDKLQRDNWKIELIYLYLPNVKLSIERVAQRVKDGGHNIDLNTIIRRYPRSIYNFINCYTPICDGVICLDNSSAQETIIFTKNTKSIKIINDTMYQNMLKAKNNG